MNFYEFMQKIQKIDIIFNLQYEKHFTYISKRKQIFKFRNKHCFSFNIFYDLCTINMIINCNNKKCIYTNIIYNNSNELFNEDKLYFYEKLINNHIILINNNYNDIINFILKIGE